MKPPKEILGVKVKSVLDTWWVEDQWGDRYYCKVKTKDGREVTLLRTEEGWRPMLVTSMDSGSKT